QGDRRLFDRHLHPVDVLVGGDDAPRLLRVHVGQSLDRAVDLTLDLSAHQDQLAAKIFELLRKMLFHGRLLLGCNQFQGGSGERFSGSFWCTAAWLPTGTARSETSRSKMRSKRSAFLRAASSSDSQSARALASSSKRRDRTRHATPVTICRWLRSRPSAM